jgi:hypothetical protein
LYGDFSGVLRLLQDITWLRERVEKLERGEAFAYRGHSMLKSPVADNKRDRRKPLRQREEADQAEGQEEEQEAAKKLKAARADEQEQLWFPQRIVEEKGSSFVIHWVGYDDPSEYSLEPGGRARPSNPTPARYVMYAQRGSDRWRGVYSATNQN